MFVTKVEVRGAAVYAASCIGDIAVLHPAQAQMTASIIVSDLVYCVADDSRVERGDEVVDAVDTIATQNLCPVMAVLASTLIEVANPDMGIARVGNAFVVIWAVAPLRHGFCGFGFAGCDIFTNEAVAGQVSVIQRVVTIGAFVGVKGDEFFCTLGSVSGQAFVITQWL